jgi:hypothetical protein
MPLQRYELDQRTDGVVELGASVADSEPCPRCYSRAAVRSRRVDRLADAFIQHICDECGRAWVSRAS